MSKDVRIQSKREVFPYHPSVSERGYKLSGHVEVTFTFDDIILCPTDSNLSSENNEPISIKVYISKGKWEKMFNMSWNN